MRYITKYNIKSRYKVKVFADGISRKTTKSRVHKRDHAHDAKNVILKNAILKSSRN